MLHDLKTWNCFFLLISFSLGDSSQHRTLKNLSLILLFLLHETSVFNSVSLLALWAIPLPLRRHHDSNAFKVKPFQSTICKEEKTIRHTQLTTKTWNEKVLWIQFFIMNARSKSITGDSDILRQCLLSWKRASSSNKIC